MKQKQILAIFFVALVLAIGIPIILIYGDPIEERYKALNLLAGKNEKVFSLGYADDGNDEITGPLKRFRNPESSAVDGLSEAYADRMVGYNSLKGRVVAKSAPGAERPAKAFLDRKVVSLFDVEESMDVGYRLENKITPFLVAGKGRYYVEIEILDSESKIVPGSQYVIDYLIKEGVKKKVAIFSEEQLLKKVRDGQIFENLVVKSNSFRLDKGEYLINFRMQLEAQSSEGATISVINKIELIDKGER